MGEGRIGWILREEIQIEKGTFYATFPVDIPLN